VPLLSLSRVDFDYGRETLLRDVTLDLEPGEKAALVGVNGSGKSTLLQIVAGTLAPDRGERHLARRARVVVLPQETLAEGAGTLLEWVKSSHEVEDVAAEIEDLHARLDGGETLDAATMERYGDLQHRFDMLGGWSHQSTVEATLLGVGFCTADFGKPLRVLSGGERRRAAVAATLLQGGDLVLLDEPTNHLDLDALEWLQQYVLQSPSAMLLVSHDRYFLDHVVSGVWHLENTTVTHWPGNYSQFRAAHAEAQGRQDTLYERQQEEIRRTEEFIRRNIAGQKTKQAQSRRKRLQKMERIERPREEHTRFRLRLRSAKRGGNVVLQARGLAKDFDGRRLFGNLDLDLERGDKLGIVGPNGAGKSTLLKILAGKLAPDAGTVRLGAEIDLGYFDQELRIVGDAPNLLEEIWRMDRSQSEEQVRAALGAFGFGTEYVDRPVRALSGGERNRLGLLKLVLMRKNFLVLDEPTNHLDLDAVAILEESLCDYDGTLLVVSHDRQLLSRAVSKLLVVAGGRTRLFHGGYEEYVRALGGAPLWSEIAAYEAERAAAQARLVAGAAGRGDGAPAGDAPRGAADRDADDAAGSAAAAPARASKNQLAKLRRQLDELENDIASLEVDLEEIEHQLAQAHTLAPAEIEAAGRRHRDTKARLAEHYASWEALSEDIEAKRGGA
jgi:ATP-binding cassette subfamily F protein 3